MFDTDNLITQCVYLTIVHLRLSVNQLNFVNIVSTRS